MNTDYIEKLGKALKSQPGYHEPWASGTVTLNGSETSFCFKCKDGSARFIDLKSITEEDTVALINACDPAPFGRGTESVLDETYRRAGKLDDGNFIWRYNPNSDKFIAELAQHLCPWDVFSSGITAEPHKLNIYSKGGFFKSHQDTPRAENMFGSLVIVLPIFHRGGNLVLRHSDRQMDFSAPTMLKSSPPGTVAWAAFYSDVEHEVLEVTDGTRVTVTYNLYFDSRRPPPILPKKALQIPENPFSTMLREVFRDAGFIRNHKYLGFGLQHQYPSEPDSATLYRIERYLKGPDAFLYRILTQLGFQPSIEYLYEENFRDSDFWVIIPKPVQGRDENDTGTTLYHMRDTELRYLVKAHDNARIVWMPGKSETTVKEKKKVHRRDWGLWNECYFFKKDVEMYRERTIEVDWVVQPTANLAGHTEYREWGNEPVQELFYFNVCIIVDVSRVPCPLSGHD